MEAFNKKIHTHKQFSGKPVKMAESATFQVGDIVRLKDGAGCLTNLGSGSMLKIDDVWAAALSFVGRPLLYPAHHFELVARSADVVQTDFTAEELKSRPFFKPSVAGFEAGDLVLCVDGQSTPLHNRHVYTVRGQTGINGNGGVLLEEFFNQDWGFAPSRFIKFEPSFEKYPYKEGDIVRCVNAVSVGRWHLQQNCTCQVEYFLGETSVVLAGVPTSFFRERFIKAD